MRLILLVSLVSASIALLTQHSTRGDEYLAGELDIAEPCACQQAAAAAPPAPQFGGCLCCRPKLTGDWHGGRNCYAQQGVTFDADVTQFYFGVTEGGLDRRFDYGGHGAWREMSSRSEVSRLRDLARSLDRKSTRL